ncbi:hypothetical protein [Halobacteriovorax sp.]|uniref:hypothetical protein n=1 Tax=Halobacteriovorax sp. TaxID=2020862 RepID=UPI003564F725
MENDNKEICIDPTEVTETNEYKGTDWGLYGILLFSFAVLLAMLITAYIDHN